MPRIAARWRISFGLAPRITAWRTTASRFTSVAATIALLAALGSLPWASLARAADEPRLLINSLLDESQPVPRDLGAVPAAVTNCEPLLDVDHRLLDVEAHRATLELCDAQGSAFPQHSLLGYEKPHPAVMLTELRALDNSWLRPRDAKRNPGMAELYWPRPSGPQQEVGTPRFTVSGLDANQQRSVIGGGLKWLTADEPNHRAHLETRGLWLCEYLQTDYTATAFYAPTDDGIFVMQGLSRGANWLLLGGGMRWQLAGGWNAYATYDAQVNSLEMFHIGSTGLRYSW